MRITLNGRSMTADASTNMPLIEPDMKLVALHGGMDCTDCSCVHLLVPADIDFDAERKVWREYYNNVYVPALEEWRHGRRASPNMIDFTQWLKDLGAVDADIQDEDNP